MLIEFSVRKLVQKPRVQVTVLAVLTLAVVAAGCTPQATRPTLNEVRRGQIQGGAVADTMLRSGERRGEVVEIDPSRGELRVVTDDGQRQAILYDRDRTQVTYHGREYSIDQLQAGDVIAYESTSGGYVDSIRIHEPVQTRAAGRATATRRTARVDVVEGTVERVQPEIGVFALQPRSGRSVTVSVPYNARPADVENFRRLRRGDFVRVEGEFVGPESFQLLAFLSPR